MLNCSVIKLADFRKSSIFALAFKVRGHYGAPPCRNPNGFLYFLWVDINYTVSVIKPDLLYLSIYIQTGAYTSDNVTVRCTGCRMTTSHPIRAKHSAMCIRSALSGLDISKPSIIRTLPTFSLDSLSIPLSLCLIWLPHTTTQRINSQYCKQYEFEGSRLQTGGLTLLLISLPADSTTVCKAKVNHSGRKEQGIIFQEKGLLLH